MYRIVSGSDCNSFGVRASAIAHLRSRPTTRTSAGSSIIIIVVQRRGILTVVYCVQESPDPDPPENDQQLRRRRRQIHALLLPFYLRVARTRPTTATYMVVYFHESFHEESFFTFLHGKSEVIFTSTKVFYFLRGSEFYFHERAAGDLDTIRHLTHPPPRRDRKKQNKYE